MVRRNFSGWTGVRNATVFLLIVLAAASRGGSSVSAQREREREQRGGSRQNNPCEVAELRKSETQGLSISSPDGKRFLVNKEDEKGTAQIYIGTTGNAKVECLTCVERPGGPKRERFKMQPRWHPSGRWIFLAVERDKYSPPPILGWNRDYVEGQLQNGVWTNMWAMSSDGSRWYRLTDFATNVKGKADGYTGPAFSNDGKYAVWSQIADGNIFRYTPFGRWELIRAQFQERNGVPSLINQKDITPAGMAWNEPGNFAPDNVSLLITGSTEKDAQGMDQYILNVETGRLENLTNTPTVWDEHGLLSPDGERVIFMSAYPYRSDPKASKVLSIKTEFMLINSDGSGLTQLTHFREPGYPEYSSKGGIAATPGWSYDGRSAHLSRLFFPNYEYWDVVFKGPCGRNPSRR
jgi:Tol biopolymer transport system component